MSPGPSRPANSLTCVDLMLAALSAGFPERRGSGRRGGDSRVTDSADCSDECHAAVSRRRIDDEPYDACDSSHRARRTGQHRLGMRPPLRGCRFVLSARPHSEGRRKSCSSDDRNILSSDPRRWPRLLQITGRMSMRTARHLQLALAVVTAVTALARASQASGRPSLGLRHHLPFER